MSTDNKTTEAANKLLDESSMDRLIHLHNKACQLREQLDAAAAECCTIFGMGFRDESTEADWVREIVDHGTHPHFVVARILQLRGQL